MQQGKDKTEMKILETEFRDFLYWLAGEFVPSPVNLNRMKNLGSVVPEDTPTVPKSQCIPS